MTTRTKRKRSYGLISRLVVIAAFVGLGGWAVFNSKFRKPDDQTAHAENEDKGGAETDKAPQTKPNEDDNAKGPAADNSKPAPVNNEPPKSGSFAPVNTPKPQTGPSAFNNKTVENIDDSTSTTAPNSFLSKFAAANNSKLKATTPKGAPKKEIKNESVRPATLNVSDDQKKDINATATNGPPSTTPPSFGPPSTSPPSSVPSFSTAANEGGSSGGFNPNKAFTPGSSGGSFTGGNPSGTASNGTSGSIVDSSSTPKTSSDPANDSPSSFTPSSLPGSVPGSKPFDPTGGGTLTAKAGATPPPSYVFGGGTQNFKEVKEVKPLRPVRAPKQPSSTNTNSNRLASDSSQGSSFAPTQSSPPSSPFGGGSFNTPSTPTGGTGGSSSLNPDNPKSGGGFSLSSDEIAGTPPANRANDLVNKPDPSPTIPRQKRTGPAFAETGVNKIVPKPAPNAIAGNRISVKPIQSDNNASGASSGSAFGSRPKSPNPSSGSSLAATPPASRSTISNNPSPRGGQSPSGFNAGATRGALASSSRPLVSNPNLSSNPTVGVGDNKPGPNSLEGAQTPAVTIRKIAPPEVQLNVEATFKIIVKNVGKTPATNVTIVDPIPVGTEFVSSVPRHTDTGTDGSLIWKFGSLAPNETKVINVNLKPVTQGEIGSVVRMSFQAAATAKTVCTKPSLEITQRGPEKVLIGQNAQFQIGVKNIGDGRAMNVSIQEIVPDGFAFADIRDDTLVYEIGNLSPNQSRNVNLTLRAVKTGKYTCKVDARMGKTLASSKVHNVEIVAPKLKMNINGPERRYIQREANYKIDLENTGTAVAQNVNMVTYLPKGMRFMSTNNRGQYVQRQHAVYWSIATLAPGNKGSVELRLMPVGVGDQEIKYEARSVLAKTELSKKPVLIDQLAELFFEVDDRDDPIEVNGETEYRVRVVNQGTKMATNVSVVAEMPVEISAIEGTGPTKSTISGRMVSFAPIEQLAPEGVAIFKIKAKGLVDGEHKIKISLSSNERRESVAKEEDTKVYSSKIR